MGGLGERSDWHVPYLNLFHVLIIVITYQILSAILKTIFCIPIGSILQCKESLIITYMIRSDDPWTVTAYCVPESTAKLATVVLIISADYVGGCSMSCRAIERLCILKLRVVDMIRSRYTMCPSPNPTQKIYLVSAMWIGQGPINVHHKLVLVYKFYMWLATIE